MVTAHSRTPQRSSILALDLQCCSLESSSWAPLSYSPLGSSTANGGGYIMTGVSNGTTKNGGVGFIGLLTIAFIVLKLTNFISWSWWWVLSPIWITASIFIFIIVFCYVMSVLTDR